MSDRRSTLGSQWDLFLLLSLLLMILMFPVLDHGNLRRAMLGVLVFVPVVASTVRLSQVGERIWLPVLLMSSAILVAVISVFVPVKALNGAKWAMLTVFFGTSIAGLFKYLRESRAIGPGHLCTAASIYLMIGASWFTLYSAIDVFQPGAFSHGSAAGNDGHAELLYFSLVTLSTLGYGDVVPLRGEVRMCAALEAMTGVFYIAITVAVLVSAYRPRHDSA
jgi:hypothetical protein